MPAASPPPAIEESQWRSGLSEINEAWTSHAGDDLRWAQPQFDDSHWPQVDIEDVGPAQPGWRWFRKRINAGPDHPNVRLLISAGDGTYELYVNGAKVEGPRLRSAFDVTRPAERVFDLTSENGDFAIALRTRAPANYAAYGLPLFLSITIGGRAAITYERQALESERMYSLMSTVAINLLLVLAGIAALALYNSQRSHRDYLFLGLYLFLLGISNGLWIPQQSGYLPTSVNYFVADPLIYLFTIAQIEFTFSFVGRRVGPRLRAYEAAVLAAAPLVILVWSGRLTLAAYVLVQTIVTAPVALLLPFVLLAWYRQGNREAGWLIIPSLLPALDVGLYNVGSASILFGWQRLDFLDEPIPLGPVPLHTTDLANLLFLLAIAFVMFFRFTHVSREQARAAAELNAAREIQQRLVPSSLPAVPGFIIETAYFPANEVGGDFYQVLTQPDCSALIVIGDVSGKGLKAAMTGALAIGAIRTLSSDCLSPAVFLARLNRQLIQSHESGFVTCLCARILAGGQITFANAGHLAPYRNGEEVKIDFGLPLGIAADAAYGESAFQLVPGDMLTLLSDGVAEARNKTGELFGFDRAAAIATQSAGSIAQAAQDFGQEDDITVLTLSFSPA